MRHLLLALALALVVVGVPVAALAGPGEKPAAAPALPPVASDADAQAAIAKFKEEFKAKGLKGDDRLSQRDFAMRELSKTKHLSVVEALAAVSRDPDPMLRTMAVVYLGEQRNFPGPAGKHVVAALKRSPDDEVLVMSCLESLGRLRYLGAREELRDLLGDRSFAIKKAAILAVGRTGDLRLLRDMLQIVGVELPNTAGDPSDPKNADGSNTKEVVEEGYSWEGAEAVVDWGLSDNTAENEAAKAQVEAKIAENKKAAEQSARGPGGGGGGDGPAMGGGGAARDTKELLPFVLATVKEVTGQKFAGPGALKKWWSAHFGEMQAKQKALDDAEKAQKSAK